MLTLRLAHERHADLQRRAPFRALRPRGYRDAERLPKLLRHWANR